MRALLVAGMVICCTQMPGTAAGFQQVLDLTGRAVDPLQIEAGTVATVLVFTTTDCPISNRYAPEIQRLATHFGAHGVRFWLVYSASTDTPRTIDAHLRSYAYTVPAVRDTGRELITRTGVTVSPEVAVLARDGRMLYRGRIDDRYVEFGRDRPVASRRDLQDALQAVVEGKPVATPVTQAVGCYLTELAK